MDVTPVIPEGKQIIEAYGDDSFTLNGTRYEGSIAIMQDRVHHWQPKDYDAVSADDFDALFQADPLPEMVVIGCGQDFRPMPQEWRQRFRTANVPVEMMDTGAACRTYNILLGEGRRVAALLIAV